MAVAVLMAVSVLHAGAVLIAVTAVVMVVLRHGAIMVDPHDGWPTARRVCHRHRPIALRPTSHWS